MPILSLISWHLGHIKTAATFIWDSHKLWSLWNASSCPEELRGQVSSIGVFAEHVPGDTAPPVAQGSCLVHIVLVWSPSCFKIFWGVIFWLRTNSIHYICLLDLSLHCPRRYVLISVVHAAVKPSNSYISEVAHLIVAKAQHVHYMDVFKQEIFGVSLAPWLPDCSLLQPGPVVVCPKAIYGAASLIFFSPWPFLCTPTGWGWTAGAILPATGEKGRNGREDEEH